ncbi:vanadium-dependent haloperoxidase [Streptomyces sp. PRB2-1]|uniref:Vanadium-dependent haloperoxidase n=1 Tax=Actinacidiphila epipremni TaxID=2053013 RepID=A0ABX0ZZB7_9ACTN|nr:vanadium-dependent haloperoxidase [Actinacidiphila epipremni]
MKEREPLVFGNFEQGTAASRRAVLLGLAGGAGLALAGPSLAYATGGTASGQGAGTAAATDDFDWDNGNAAYSVVAVQADPVMLNYFAGSDASLVIRVTTILENAWFDAIAPYHPTCIGVYSNLGRRPASEGATNRNKNIALLYASYRTFQFLLPEADAQWRAMVSSVGMDPDDDQENTTTPIGIGNLAAKGVIAGRSHDGGNQLGDVDWGPYNRQRYRDYTGFEPVNTAYELRDASKWQPRIKTNGAGLYTVQQFVTPQFKDMKPYTYDDPSVYLVKPPTDSDPHRNPRGYKQQADEVLARSANLDDLVKLKAEVFNDKFLALGESTGIAAANAGLNLDQFVQLHMATAIAGFDATIAVWYNKYHYNAVRPFSAIRHIYGDRHVTAWGGPGKGTVHNLKASQWAEYISVADHPEYPSVSTTLCEAHAQACRRFLGTDNVDLNFTFPKGSSVVEPGITPAQDLTVHFDTWTDFAHACGQARIDGGVHFPAAVEIGYEIGPQFGDLGYDFVMKHVNGNV